MATEENGKSVVFFLLIIEDENVLFVRIYFQMEAVDEQNAVSNVNSQQAATKPSFV